MERACANNTSELPETPGVAEIFAKFEAGYTARTGAKLGRITPGAPAGKGPCRAGWDERPPSSALWRRLPTLHTRDSLAHLPFPTSPPSAPGAEPAAKPVAAATTRPAGTAATPTVELIPSAAAQPAAEPAPASSGPTVQLVEPAPLVQAASSGWP